MRGLDAVSGLRSHKVNKGPSGEHECVGLFADASLRGGLPWMSGTGVGIPDRHVPMV
jgi:hypothetical protein